MQCRSHSPQNIYCLSGPLRKNFADSRIGDTVLSSSFSRKGKESPSQDKSVFLTTEHTAGQSPRLTSLGLKRIINIECLISYLLQMIPFNFYYLSQQGSQVQGSGLFVFLGSLRLQSILILQNAHFSEKSVSLHDRRSHTACFLSLSFPSEHDKIMIPASPRDPRVSLKKVSFCLPSFKISFKPVRQSGKCSLALEADRSECESWPCYLLGCVTLDELPNFPEPVAVPR